MEEPETLVSKKCSKKINKSNENRRVCSKRKFRELQTEIVCFNRLSDNLKSDLKKGLIEKMKLHSAKVKYPHDYSVEHSNHYKKVLN